MAAATRKRRQADDASRAADRSRAEAVAKSAAAEEAGKQAAQYIQQAERLVSAISPPRTGRPLFVYTLVSGNMVSVSTGVAVYELVLLCALSIGAGRV